jgi:hypothetical protein
MLDRNIEELGEVIARARQRSVDRALIRTLRAIVVGIAALGVLFVAYAIALVIISSHDKRVEALEQRVHALETR